MRCFSSFFSLLTAVLATSQVLGQINEATNAPSARDQAEAVSSSMATPAAGEPVLDPNEQAAAALEEFLQYQIKQQKNWKLRLFTSANWRYDTNVMLSDTRPQSDNMWTARPGFQYLYGDNEATLQFTLDGTVDFNYFDKFSDQNSINKFLATSLTYRLQKTTLKFNGYFSDVTGGNLDVGGQAQRMQFRPDLQLTHNFTEKTRFGLSAQMQNTNYTSLISSVTYRYGTFADYALSPHLRLGVQVNQMIQDVSGLGTQTGQDYLFRMELELLKKFFATGSMGVSTLQPKNGTDIILPSGNVSLRYALSPKTSLNASIYARSQNSPSLAGQYFQSNGVMIGFQQQIGTKLNFGTNVGYDHSTYGTYSGNLSNGRQDQLYFVRPWLKYTLNRHLAFDLSYQHTINASSGAGSRGFTRDLFGMGITSSW
jgi:hypothetical protein